MLERHQLFCACGALLALLLEAEPFSDIMLRCDPGLMVQLPPSYHCCVSLLSRIEESLFMTDMCFFRHPGFHVAWGRVEAVAAKDREADMSESARSR